MERKHLIIAGTVVGVACLLIVVAVVGHRELRGERGERDMMGDRNERSEMGFNRDDERGKRPAENNTPNTSDGVYSVDPSDYINSADYISDTPALSLNAAETSGLLLMREEEKLARDVYTTLGDKWGIQIFSNIASSEQTHMTAIGDLIEKYGLVDPVKENTVGVFTNPDLQKLYTELTERGMVSSAEALQVGALIEDLDIYDLERLIGETDKSDIMAVYQNLQKGSRNHMRAFVSQITRGGGEYVPQYISAADYQSINSAQQERGRI